MLVLNNSCHKNMWMIFEGCHRLYNIHIFEALFLHVVAGDWFWIFPPHEQNALPWIIPVQMSRCLKSAYSYLIIEQRDNVPLSLCSMRATLYSSQIGRVADCVVPTAIRVSADLSGQFKIRLFLLLIWGLISSSPRRGGPLRCPQAKILVGFE